MSKSVLIRAVAIAGATAMISLCGNVEGVAQTPADVLLDPINVQGSRNRGAALAGNRPAEQYRLTEPVPSVRIERKEIETLPNDRASDILIRMPGVVVTGPPGEKKSFGLRGMTPDFTRVQVDGFGLPSASQNRSLELMNVPGFLLDEVKIVRNPGAEYEADGIAGRIVLTTRDLPTRSGIELRGAAGGTDRLFDGRNSQAGVTVANRFSDTFGAVGALNYDRRRITKTKDFSEHTYQGGPGGLGMTIDQSEPKDFTNIDGLLQFGWNWGTGSFVVRGLLLDETVNADGSRRDQYRRVPLTFQSRTLSGGEESTQVGTTSVRFQQALSPAVDLWIEGAASKASLRVNNGSTAYGSSLAFSSGSAEDSNVDDEQFDISSKMAWRPDTALPQEIKFGLAGRRLKRDSGRELYTVNISGVRSQTAADLTASRDSDYKATETFGAAFIQNAVKLGRLTVTPGARVEHVTDDLNGGLGASKPEFTDFLPSLVSSYRLTDRINVTSAISRQVNRPTLEQIAPGLTRRGPRVYEGNPNVKPARSWSYDAGANYVTPDLFLGANLFYRDVTDIIESVEIATNQYRTINAGDGWARGVELEQRIGASLLGLKDLAPLSLITNQTFLESKVFDPITGPRPFSETPRFVSNWTLMWNDEAKGTMIAASLNYVSKRVIVSNDGNGVIRYKEIRPTAFLDLKAEQRIAPGVSIFASAENLLDEVRDEFELTNGTLARTAVIATGRVFYAGVKGSF